MTRSVEIPEEAVRDAIAAFDDFEMRAMNAVEDQDAHFEDAMRVALAAALPYLAPAELGGRTLCANCTACLDGCPDCAPAGDGGLRRDLEGLANLLEAEEQRPNDGLTYQRVIGGLRHLLNGHPPAPAVPQPAANRERMIEVLGGSELAAATVDHLLESGVIRDAAVLQPVDREALTQALLTVWLGRIETQVADSPEGHCAALADAVLALLNGSEVRP